MSVFRLTFPHRAASRFPRSARVGVALALFAGTSCSSSENTPPAPGTIKPTATSGTQSTTVGSIDTNGDTFPVETSLVLPGTNETAGTSTATGESTTPGASAIPTGGGNTSSSSPPTSGASNVPPGVVLEDDEGLIIETTPPVSTINDLPLNLGTELECDDKDENDNGIVDDVDIGKDGLCDCIHIGFFGEIASDAGQDTASFDAWLIERSGQVPIKRLAADETLTAEWLASLQVLIIGGMQERAAAGGAFTAEEIAAFDDWVRNRGGGVMTLSGYTATSDDAQPTNELLANTGLGYDLGTVQEQGVIGEAAPPVWLNDIAAPDHPTVDQVTEIGVYYGYPVEGDGTVILQGEGYDLAMAKQVGNGRVFVFADEWITQDATWAGLSNGQANPCQQPCNEQENICRIAEMQCAQCEMQPCSDPNDTDAGTCSKGCQPSCDSETTRCQTNTELCAECTAEADARAEATPRLWLNTIGWLTPDSECKVEIPPSVRVR